MLYREEIWELSDKLNGIIWKKVEESKNIFSVYSIVFDRLQKIEDPDDVRSLEILGDLGG
ncbi:MAG: hypothetical protein ACP5H3_00475 [Candidatus Aenigmatarchaeota archaeon]|jgi:hypothetical protein